MLPPWERPVKERFSSDDEAAALDEGVAALYPETMMAKTERGRRSVNTTIQAGLGFGTTTNVA